METTLGLKLPMPIEGREAAGLRVRKEVRRAE